MMRQLRAGPGRAERGQSMVEILVVLPSLIILMVVVAEAGFVLRNYLLVANANREAARFAARGQYSDSRIGERASSAGGIIRLYGQQVPYLRTHGTEPNMGIIITHIPLDTSGNTITQTTWVSGVVGSPDGTIRPVHPPPSPGEPAPDSRIDLNLLKNRHKPITEQINQIREDAGFEELVDHIVVVEMFFTHRPLLLTSLIPIADLVPLYAQTTARITAAHETQAQ